MKIKEGLNPRQVENNKLKADLPKNSVIKEIQAVSLEMLNSYKQYDRRVRVMYELDNKLYRTHLGYHVNQLDIERIR